MNASLRRSHTALNHRHSWSSHLTFGVFVFGAFVFLTVPRMAQAGMFLDGVTYAAVARNFAEGLGSFWSLHYSETVYPVFREHPPLGMAVQSMFFRILGDHLYVERLFSFLIGLATATLMVLVWRRTGSRPEFGWIALLFWLLPSTVTWGINNNLLENIQTVWTTAAVLAGISAVFAPTRAGALLASAGMAACILAAVLTKGPVGLFPLVIPVIGSAARGVRFTRALLVLSSVVVLLSLAALWIVSDADARRMFADYYAQQLGSSLSGSRGRDGWRELARHFWGGILLRMGILFVLGVLVARPWVRGRSLDRDALRWGVFFLAAGLAASLPIALSPRITGHYLIPSIPMYALAFASFATFAFGDQIQLWMRSRRVTRAVGATGVTLLIVGIAAPAVGWSYEGVRDREYIADYRSLGSALDRGEVIGSCAAVKEQWGIHAYMMRFFRVSVAFDDQPRSGKFLQLNDAPCVPPPGCQPSVQGARLTLHTCRPANGESDSLRTP